jgi:hypothetical protein
MPTLSQDIGGISALSGFCALAALRHQQSILLFLAFVAVTGLCLTGAGRYFRNAATLWWLWQRAFWM